MDREDHLAARECAHVISRYALELINSVGLLVELLDDWSPVNILEDRVEVSECLSSQTSLLSVTGLLGFFESCERLCGSSPEVLDVLR